MASVSFGSATVKVVTYFFDSFSKTKHKILVRGRGIITQLTMDFLITNLVPDIENIVLSYIQVIFFLTIFPVFLFLPVYPTVVGGLIFFSDTILVMRNIGKTLNCVTS